MSDAPFRTPAGSPVPAVTAEEMREVDQVAVDEVGLGLLQMMENAGRTLAWHARDVATEASAEASAEDGDAPVVVLAGAGGNGGGGLAAARHLANHDVGVVVVLDRDPDDLEGAAARQHGVLAEMSVRVVAGPDGLDDIAEPAVVVDAVIGYGLGGEVREPARSLVQWANRRSEPVVSLDVPSGIDATTGEVLGVAVDPIRTVTLAMPKTGLVGPGGDLFLADIGIPRTVYDRLDIPYSNPFGAGMWVALERG